MQNTKIDWADMTWNPVTGCTRVSAGCDNCYARREHDRRHKALLAGRKMAPQYAEPFELVQCHTGRLDQPLRWRRPRRIFVCSGSDLFHEAVPMEFIGEIFGIMAAASRHTFIVLTKRPRRQIDFHEWLRSERWPTLWPPAGEPDYPMDANVVLDLVRGPHRDDGCPICPDHRCRIIGDVMAPLWPLPNVHVGVSVEDENTLHRVELLMQTAAAVRFVSYEPALGPVDFAPWLTDIQLRSLRDLEGEDPKPLAPEPLPALDGIICGGESGPKARPMHPDWAREVRDQCGAAGVPFFFKQWGMYAPADQFEAATIMRYRDRYGYGLTQCKPELIRYALGDGTFAPAGDGAHGEYTMMLRVGKKKAGRVLDGRTHDELPGLATNEVTDDGQTSDN